MKKDVIIAVLIGFIVGGGAALALTNIPSLIKTTQKSRSEQIATTISPSITENGSSKIQNDEIPLIIEKPQQDSISEEKTIIVSGKSKAENVIIVDTDLESQAASTAIDGTFSVKVSLGEGLNNLYIASYDDKGEKIEKTITVFYTPEKL